MSIPPDSGIAWTISRREALGKRFSRFPKERNLKFSRCKKSPSFPLWQRGDERGIFGITI
jgi:hypothetical protein